MMMATMEAPYNNNDDMKREAGEGRRCLLEVPPLPLGGWEVPPPTTIYRFDCWSAAAAITIVSHQAPAKANLSPCKLQRADGIVSSQAFPTEQIECNWLVSDGGTLQALQGCVEHGKEWGLLETMWLIAL
jgi:hypothetical protein